MTKPTFRAVAFDLLTALIDSWSLWIDIAGEETLGRNWRLASLKIVTSCGSYQPYEAIVHRAAAEVGIPDKSADDLLARWGELRPWPEAPAVLQQLAGRRLAIMTNCSQKCAEIAAAATGGNFELIMSAERAGIYKTDPRAYLAMVNGLGLKPEEILFVAGSAHDVPGAGNVGMKVYWSNRLGLPVPDGAPAPLVNAPNLLGLPELLASAG